jgi:hypothetical protein
MAEKAASGFDMGIIVEYDLTPNFGLKVVSNSYSFALEDCTLNCTPKFRIHGKNG